MTKSNLIFPALVGIIFSSHSVLADAREQYSVTGESGDINAFYHDMMECDAATEDAQSQAEQKCYSEGFNNGWVYAQYGDCHSRLFGGKWITMTFYCN